MGARNTRLSLNGTSLRSYTDSIQLIPWKRVLLELIVKKFPAFYGTRRFITVFTTACNWSAFWARWLQSTTLHRISQSSIPLLSSNLRLGFSSALFPSGFPTRTVYHVPCVWHAPPMSSYRFYLCNCYTFGVESCHKILLPFDGLRHFSQICSSCVSISGNEAIVFFFLPSIWHWMNSTQAMRGKTVLMELWFSEHYTCGDDVRQYLFFHLSP
jgi:hypothetical protein